MEIWKSGYCDSEVQRSPSVPVRVKTAPTDGGLNLFKALREITGYGWQPCADLVRQGFDFTVAPDKWGAFLAAMDTFDLLWYRHYAEEPTAQPFYGPDTVVCQLLARPGAATCLVLSTLMQNYVGADLDQSTRAVIIDAAIHNGHPFTITEGLWAEFNNKMDELPQVKWTALCPPCTG